MRYEFNSMGFDERWQLQRAEPELAQLEGQPILLRERPDRPTDGPAVRLNAVVGVRNREAQSPFRRDLVHQVEQRHRVRAAGHGDDRPTGPGEQARTREMGADALREQSHAI